MIYNDQLKLFSVKDKDKKHQGESCNEQKTSAVRCHAMLQRNTIVSCTASLVHMNIRIIAVSFIHTFISLFLNQSASQAFSRLRHMHVTD